MWGCCYTMASARWVLNIVVNGLKNGWVWFLATSFVELFHPTLVFQDYPTTSKKEKLTSSRPPRNGHPQPRKKTARCTRQFWQAQQQRIQLGGQPGGPGETSALSGVAPPQSRDARPWGYNLTVFLSILSHYIYLPSILAITNLW